jgi:hypothetical protein
MALRWKRSGLCPGRSDVGDLVASRLRKESVARRLPANPRYDDVGFKNA